MSFIPRFTLHGGPYNIMSYGVTAAQEWDVGDCVAMDGAGALIELAADDDDVLGSAAENVGNVTAGQPDADELMAYIDAVTTGKVASAWIFDYGNVFETDDYNNEGAAVVADIGTTHDLELVGVNWGIDMGATATAAHPNFRIIDIVRVPQTYLVVPDFVAIAEVFQWFDAQV